MENQNKKKRKEGLFHPEGKVMYVLTKAGWIILLPLKEPLKREAALRQER